MSLFFMQESFFLIEKSGVLDIAVHYNISNVFALF